MNVSQYIACFLKASGVKTAFELSGGMIMHLLDAVHQEGGVELINVYHEQAAAFAADAVGRMSGIPGVAFGTSGPGAINLLTGIGSSFFDSSPTVFITGQVNRHEQKGARGIRQLGFQETDIVTMAGPLTKWAHRVTDASDVPESLCHAFRTATEGRPGAVLLDIPMDVFRSQVLEPLRPWAKTPAAHPGCNLSLLEQLQTALQNSQRPLVLAGGGIRASGSHKAFLEFVHRTQIPVVHSLLACDSLPYNHPQRVGMIGTYGNRWANLALSECDVLLVLGSRLDIRQTGADTESFSSGRTIFHVDVESEEINNRIRNCVPLITHLADFFSAAITEIGHVACEGWASRIRELRAEWPDTKELSGAIGINPNILMHEISSRYQVAAYCVDVGLHQMWAAQSLELSDSTRFLTSGGMGAMGFSLPAALGAAFHLEKKSPVVVIAGDGGFQLNIQELQSIVHHQLPIKIIVANNHCHGMTRQFQDTYFGARYVGTAWGYSAPSFRKVAEAYGIPAIEVSRPEELIEAADWFWKDPLSPCLMEVQIDFATNAYPKLAFGRPISQMEPLATPIEMEAT